MDRQEFRKRQELSYTSHDVEQALKHADQKEGVQVLNLTESYQLRVTNFLARIDSYEDNIGNAGSIE